ncbi:DUF397 domain-containing protein [Streptomyces formicae]|uniref:DUF397 domain-containing protein n=1 Tax=Streptomyces formicae TaxID=1616117 RepID=A0A291Q8S3_9ACTN|nr:DUF397 domain-containing protein [Streptomyces formicae]ATL28099.1 hypothetical protein KY5_3081c [Streptomyces formicae]
MIGKVSVGGASGLAWFKSSYSSSSETDDCVEVATTPHTIHIRDSKTPTAPHFTVTPNAWSAFLTYTQR